MAKAFSSQARHFMILPPDEARRMIVEERKEDAIKFLDFLQTALPLNHKKIRKGKLYNFECELAGYEDKFLVDHPRYGRLRFETMPQFIAWVLQQYV